MLKQLGLISILSMWIGTYILIKQHNLDSGKTISKHAAKNTRYHVLYGLLELSVVSLFSIFIFGWFIPEFKLGHSYTLVAIIGVTGTVIAALVADRDGWKGKVHATAAYSMAMSLLLMSLIMLLSPTINTLTRTLLYISITYMSVGSIIAVIYPHIYRHSALKLQVIYFLMFQVPIIAATYS